MALKYAFNKLEQEFLNEIQAAAEYIPEMFWNMVNINRKKNPACCNFLTEEMAVNQRTCRNS